MLISFSCYLFKYILHAQQSACREQDGSVWTHIEAYERVMQ